MTDDRTYQALQALFRDGGADSTMATIEGCPPRQVPAIGHNSVVRLRAPSLMQKLATIGRWKNETTWQSPLSYIRDVQMNHRPMASLPASDGYIADKIFNDDFRVTFRPPSGKVETTRAMQVLEELYPGQIDYDPSNHTVGMHADTLSRLFDTHTPLPAKPLHVMRRPSCIIRPGPVHSTLYQLFDNYDTHRQQAYAYIPSDATYHPSPLAMRQYGLQLGFNMGKVAEALAPHIMQDTNDKWYGMVSLPEFIPLHDKIKHSHFRQHAPRDDAMSDILHKIQSNDFYIIWPTPCSDIDLHNHRQRLQQHFGVADSPRITSNVAGLSYVALPANDFQRVFDAWTKSQGVPNASDIARTFAGSRAVNLIRLPASPSSEAQGIR